MRKLSILLALVAGLFTSQAYAANFSAKDAAAATIIFTNPGNCTTGCTPIFAWTDSTGANVVGVITAGADAASNTATGGITYSRTMTFNGTTWDRWTGAVTATLAAETTKVIGTVRIASGGVASGSFASGSIASGALASGSIASGAMVDLGSQADAACGSDNGTCSAIALIKRGNQTATTTATAVQASIPAGTALIGDVNLRQGGTALSTTNGIYSNVLQGNAVLSATNPSFARPTDGTNARVFDPCEVVAHVTTPISINTAATSVIVAGTSAKKTYICSMMLFAAGTTNVGIVQGSGSTCGTSTLGLIGGATAATGPNLTAQAGFVAGNGNFAIAGTTVNANDTCLINSAAIQVSGYIVTATP